MIRERVLIRVDEPSIDPPAPWGKAQRARAPVQDAIDAPRVAAVQGVARVEQARQSLESLQQATLVARDVGVPRQDDGTVWRPLRDGCHELLDLGCARGGV